MKKTSFSLVELLIGLSLISLVVGTLSFSLASFISKNQFERESEALQGHLQLAYDLVLNYDIDLDISFHYLGKTLICEISSNQESLLKSFERIKKFRHLNTIALISNDRGKKKRVLEQGSNINEKLKLSFSYYGGLQKPCHLVLTGSVKQKLSFFIKGFPHVITQEKNILFAS